MPFFRFIRRLFFAPWFCKFCLSPMLPCAAQNPHLFTADIAGNKPSVTVPFATGSGPSDLIYIEARINGKGPYVFVLDTGLNVSLLRPDIARLLKLPITGESSLLEGISGDSLP